MAELGPWFRCLCAGGHRSWLRAPSSRDRCEECGEPFVAVVRGDVRGSLDGMDFQRVDLTDLPFTQAGAYVIKGDGAYVFREG